MWDQDCADWVVSDTGELLSGYIPSDDMKKLVTEKIIVRTGFDSS